MPKFPRTVAAVCIAFAFLAAGAPPVCAADADQAWADLRWGDTSAALAARFGARARILARPIDFGDSYAQVVLPHVAVGGVPVVAFFQMDKATGGLKRIQFERQRHGVNPPAFRAVVAGLDAAYGAPERECDIPPGPASGWQAATELSWRRGGNLIRAIFRDTTIEAFEGCLFGDLTLGPCGLTGQLLVRISPAGSDRTQCPAAANGR
ncbi:MAG TPA: hypothetical protein VJR70_12435 [Stellaceae bacterium]|nr:hypothetical protein [Stellaceae bacterium]